MLIDKLVVSLQRNLFLFLFLFQVRSLVRSKIVELELKEQKLERLAGAKNPQTGVRMLTDEKLLIVAKKLENIRTEKFIVR
jgi:hypothetical protein